MKLPSEFEARTLEWMGEETYRALEAALQTEPPVSIRVNRTKWSGEVAGEPVLWASAGVYLSQRPTFTFDPLFHAGCYYVQEASSMFVEQVLRTYITGPVVMLDLCAAPGSNCRTHHLLWTPFLYRSYCTLVQVQEQTSQIQTGCRGSGSRTNHSGRTVQ